MTTSTWSPRPLPSGVVGAKVQVYDALIGLASEAQSGVSQLADGEVYFRKADLVLKSGVSAPHVSACLRWLRENEYVDYTPGGPGMLSRVQVAREGSGS